MDLHNRLFFLSFVAFALLVPRISAASDRPCLRGENVVVCFDPSLREVARPLRRGYPSMKAEVERKIGWKMKARPRVVLIGNRFEYEKTGGSPDTSAFALIGKAVVVVDLASLDRFVELDHTLKHELTHILIHEHIRAALPDWFEEGVCEWVGMPRRASAGAFFEDPFKAYSLYSASVPLSRLVNFHSSGAPLSLGYIESGEFIRYIADRYGEIAVPRMLALLQNGKTLDQAFSRVLFKPVSSVEADWRALLASRARWIILVRDGSIRAVRAGGFLINIAVARYRLILLYILVLTMIFVTARKLFRKRAGPSGRI